MAAGINTGVAQCAGYGGHVTVSASSASRSRFVDLLCADIGLGLNTLLIPDRDSKPIR